MRKKPGNVLTFSRGSRGPAEPVEVDRVGRASAATLASAEGRGLRAMPRRLSLCRYGPMTSPEKQDVTRLLESLDSGDRAVLDALYPLVYGELRRLARSQLSRERPGHTLDSVALVNEAYLRLVDQDDIRWQNRAHFFGVSARAMRAILVDHARARNAAKRGAGGVAVPLDEIAELVSDEQAERVEQLDEALTRLAFINQEASRTVECLYFGGLTLEETAEALGMSVATVRRRWSFAKAWLGRALGDEH
ncbi:MAG TPA: sigma-70 family RNA polymerase sigma factor [Gemmatimonadaceae bacterium]|nr:sigma-70 family RNA polymerase sigma factor [Gemmatimonadaceae bacterium]